MAKKVAVILSGCGVYDGSEINETVLALLALEEQGLAYECFAPNKNQHKVVNHMTGEVMQEVRNVMVEAARIVRGKIKSIEECQVDQFDALLLPGGFGVVSNLSDFASAGTNLGIDPTVEQQLIAFKSAKKPVACLCIAPVLLPKIYGKGVKVTIGNDPDTSNTIQKMGGEAVNAKADEVVYDPHHNVLTTPCYMLAKSIHEAKSGIDALVKKLAQLL